ncbi:MAG: right-handed parallel beta-helix repeat-containing protein, partial [Planctomycetales bacterium]
MSILRAWLGLILCALAASEAAGQYGPQGSLRRQWGQEPGFEDGYSRFGGFVPLWGDPECRGVLFSDSQLTLSDEILASGSVGLGGRVYLDDLDAFLGLNGYWDRRQYDSDLGRNEFDQFGFGLELLGPAWAVRSNLYLNAGGQVRQRRLMNAEPFYQGNLLVLQSLADRVDEAMQGGDFELARQLDFVPGEVALGAYHLQARGGTRHHAYGLAARAQVWVREQFLVFGSLRNDRVFGTTVAGGLAWHFGGGARGESRSLCQRITDTVERRYQVPVVSSIQGFGQNDMAAVDPTTGQAITFTHVDAAAATGGNGTFEAPHNALASASNSADSVVLVQPGEYSSGITLSENQRLLAASKARMIATQVGTLALPETGLGGATVISGAPEDAITIANGAEVSGFTIQNPGDDGIAGENVVGFNINCNVITGAGDRGIELNGVNSGVLVENRADNNAGEGMYVFRMNAGTVSDNIASGNGGSGVALAFLEGNSMVERNVMTGNAANGFMSNSIFDAVIRDNIANGNGLAGFGVGAFVGGEILGNAANDNLEGFNLGDMTGGILQGNVADRNARSGVIVATLDGGVIANNRADQNGANGFLITTLNDGVIRDNTAGENGVDGFHVTTLNDGDVRDNIANGNRFAGFFIDRMNGGALTGNAAEEDEFFGYRIRTLDGGLVEDNLSRIVSDQFVQPHTGFLTEIMLSGTMRNNRAEGGNAGFQFFEFADGILEGNVAE